MSAAERDDGGSAFPVHERGNQPNVDELNRDMRGMTLRDYFAAKAMQGLMANAGGPVQSNGLNGWNLVNCEPCDVAGLSYGIADAMLKARKA